MAKLVIEDILGAKDSKERVNGLYGKTSAYLGVVEQQGRLTLHLHMMVWLEGCPSPKDMRERILSDKVWQTKVVQWLEGCHQGEFLTGTLQEVHERREESRTKPEYRDPTTTLPVPPPVHPSSTSEACKCRAHTSWWGWFKSVVDDILLRSNIHDCKRKIKKDGSKSARMTYTSCTDNKWKKCRARFPRKTRAFTEVDAETGALAMKKGEAWMNTFSSVLTYLLGCNTDVTSMLSGTAVKAVIVYVTDYITKPGLKTHVAFDAIRTILSK
ncbi:hypothetical protein BKA70DRAFT_1104794, partial [Coprinopsis sp. MPI-PUGE-AT-0042]